MRKSIIVIASLFVMAELVNTPPSVQAAAPFATEFTQLANWGQLLSVNLTAATQLANEIQQLQNSIRNLILLPNQIFGPIQADINALAGVVQGGLSLAYSMANLNARFTNRFKGFAGFTRNNYYTNYQTWSQTSLDTTLGTLQAAGLQGQQFTERAGRLDLASNNGANLGRRDGGAAGTRRDFRAGGSAADEASRTYARRFAEQAGVSGRRDSAAGQRRSRSAAILPVRRGQRRWSYVSAGLALDGDAHAYMKRMKCS